MDEEHTKRVRWLHNSLPPDWDSRPLSLAHEMMRLLEGVKDEGTSIDSGTDGTTGDLWIRVQGVEWHIAIRKSLAQINDEKNG